MSGETKRLVTDAEAARWGAITNRGVIWRKNEVCRLLDTRAVLMRHLRELLECHDVLNVKAGGSGHGSHPQTRTLLRQLRGEDA